MRKYLNLNTIILVASGVFLMGWGAWRLYTIRDYMFGGGVFLIGLGNLMFGITNGFADQTPRGRVFFKVAMFSYIFGVSSVAYTLRYLI